MVVGSLAGVCCLLFVVGETVEAKDTLERKTKNILGESTRR